MVAMRPLRAALRVSAVAMAATLVIVAANERVLSEINAVGPSASAGPFDVALVPGCHVSGLRPAPTLRARLEVAEQAYLAHRVKRILVTGNAKAGETEAMRHWLVEKGVPDRDILVDGDGTRTLESVKNAAAAFSVRSALICTQKLYMARSLFLARHAGLDAAGLEAGLDATAAHVRAIETLKRAVAFGEVAVGRLEPSTSALASNVDLE
ncbi:MAG: hypothetical protein JWM82_4130 [Myxococcales bacterium]|nr:hypothetical protein [Myxococcales bacterium]